jgi:steroid delta-isomerase-like uncharacterized protein
MTPVEAVAAWYAAISSGDEATLAGMLHPAFVAHQAGRDLDASAMRWFRDIYRGGVPDLKVEHTVIHAAAEFAVAATVSVGTHSGPFLGHPPTGRTFRATGLDVFRLQEGRIAELWGSFDTDGMLRQLGLAGEAR